MIFRYSALAMVVGFVLSGCGDNYSDGNADAGSDRIKGADSDTDSNRDRGSDDSSDLDSDTVPFQCTEISVAADTPGLVYLDGFFTGLSVPSQIGAPTSGAIRVGVATEDGRFLERSLNPIPGSCEISLTGSDALAPVTWKGLFVGIRQAQTVGCAPSFTTEELDAWFSFLKDSLRDSLEPFAMGLHHWQLDRIDVQEPVPITSPNGYAIIEPTSLSAFEELAPGDYDNLFVVWRGLDDTCEIAAPYFGLAYVEETKMVGWVMIRTPEVDVLGTLEYLRAEDPGVFVHEWLHTAVDAHYAAQGAPLPNPADDGSVVHAGEDHGYQFPWMDWYRDLISGRVEEDGTFRGVGPNLLQECTIREWALGTCVVDSKTVIVDKYLVSNAVSLPSDIYR